MRGGGQGKRQVDILQSKSKWAIKGISFVFDCLPGAGTNSDYPLDGELLIHRSEEGSFSGREGGGMAAGVYELGKVLQD